MRRAGWFFLVIAVVIALAVFLAGACSGNEKSEVSPTEVTVTPSMLFPRQGYDFSLDYLKRAIREEGNENTIARVLQFSRKVEVQYLNKSNQVEKKIIIYGIACAKNIALPRLELLMPALFPEGYDQITGLRIFLYPEKEPMRLVRRGEFFDIFRLPEGTGSADCKDFPYGQTSQLEEGNALTFLPEFIHSHITQSKSPAGFPVFAVEDITGASSGSIVVAYREGLPEIVGMLLPYISEQDYLRAVLFIDQLLPYLE